MSYGNFLIDKIWEIYLSQWVKKKDGKKLNLYYPKFLDEFNFKIEYFNSLKYLYISWLSYHTIAF